jgi:hypothetical protein
VVDKLKGVEKVEEVEEVKEVEKWEDELLVFDLIALNLIYVSR